MKSYIHKVHCQLSTEAAANFTLTVIDMLMDSLLQSTELKRFPFLFYATNKKIRIEQLHLIQLYE